MIKIKTFQLIGIFTAIIGIINLYSNISGVLYSPSSLLIKVITGVVLSWIAIYGGYQAIKLRLIGLKLLRIFITFQVLQIIFVVIAFIFWAANNHLGDIQFASYQSQPFLTISLAILYILALILLLRKNTASFLQLDTNLRHSRIVGKILSVVTPGLGRALVGNTLIGIIILYIYFSLMTGFSISIGLFNDFIAKLCIWIFFLGIDWYYVTYATEAQRDLESHPISSSSTNESG